MTAVYTTAEFEQAVRLRGLSQSADVEHTTDVAKKYCDPGRSIVMGLSGNSDGILVGQSSTRNDSETVAKKSESVPSTTREPVSVPIKRQAEGVVQGSPKRPNLSITDPQTPLPLAIAVTVNYSSINSRSRGKGDGLGCSIYCGPPDKKPLVVSSFMRANQSLFSKIPSLRQEVADYCFLDDWSMDLDEIVADYGGNARLTRRDVLSLLPDRNTTPNVIECWSRLLNIIEADHSKVPRMAFLGIHHMEALTNLLNSDRVSTPVGNLKDKLYSIWDNFVSACGNIFNMDAGLFFIPLLIDNHFAAICINFKANTIDILDNQKLVLPLEESEVTTFGEFAAIDGASDYFEKWDLEKGGLIPNFKTRWIKFKWQTSEPNDFESGLFTMMHMVIYEGSEFDDENIRLKKNRRYLVVELAAALLLADCNNVRDNLLQKVNDFIENKDPMWKKIKDHRDFIKEVAKQARR